MAYIETHGASLKDSREHAKEDRLHHLVISADDGSSSKHPVILVEHFHGPDDRKPTEHRFKSKAEMLVHLVIETSIGVEDGKALFVVKYVIVVLLIVGAQVTFYLFIRSIMSQHET